MPRPLQYDTDIPPLVSCALCGESACAGDCALQNAAESAPLRWELPRERAPWWSALWSTAEAITLVPKQALAELGHGSVHKALSFALIAESIAVASLGCPLLLGVWLLFPDWSQRALMTRDGGALVISSLLGFAVLVVMLHATFGLAFEFALGRGQSGHQLARTLRFSLYACGWDLWTSPCGILMGLLFKSKQRTRGIDIVFTATSRAPRAAAIHYVKVLRGLSDQETPRVLRTTLLLAAPLSVIATVGWLYATVWGIVHL